MKTLDNGGLNSYFWDLTTNDPLEMRIPHSQLLFEIACFESTVLLWFLHNIIFDQIILWGLVLHKCLIEVYMH